MLDSIIANNLPQDWVDGLDFPALHLLKELPKERELHFRRLAETEAAFATVRLHPIPIAIEHDRIYVEGDVVFLGGQVAQTRVVEHAMLNGLPRIVDNLENEPSDPFQHGAQFAGHVFAVGFGRGSVSLHSFPFSRKGR